MKYIIFICSFALLLFGNCDKEYKTNNFETETSGFEVYTGDSIEAVWKYTIINKTKKDYNFPNDPQSIFSKHKDEKGLSQDCFVKWETNKYLPPSETISVSFSTFYQYNDVFTKEYKDDLEKLSKFMENKMSDLQSFVILDKNKRYKIEFFNTYADTTKKKTMEKLE
ncbi:MAG: hypothetical protein JW922_09555 [Paludibacteraceae bacterium]|nr:hypothetical protein [Paludibacteraceae bacterium]